MTPNPPCSTLLFPHPLRLQTRDHLLIPFMVLRLMARSFGQQSREYLRRHCRRGGSNAAAAAAAHHTVLDEAYEDRDSTV